VNSRVIIGVDVGGTFTDAVIVRPENHSIEIVKTLTNIHDPGNRIVEIVSRCSAASNVRIYHATTLTSNILLGQIRLDLPKILLVVNRGFRDIIYIGRQNRIELYSLKPRRAKIPGTIEIFEIDERTLPDGKVEVEPTLGELNKLVEEIEKKRPDVVCICLLNSYVNPSSELRIKKFIKERVSNIDVVCSHEICTTRGEYERFCTALISSLLRPLVRRYMNKLVEKLRSIVENFQLSVATSWGGLVNVHESVRRPVILLESGPAAGVIACSKLCSIINMSRAIAFDMGGTTAKFSPIVDHEPLLRDEYEIAMGVHGCRIQRRTGIPIMIDMIDIVEVSAGGGTIIWIDEAGAVRVGPKSAGSDPGPACYERGGTDPTITDANLVLGRIFPKIMLGDLKVSREAALRAFNKLKDITGREVEEIAYDAIRKINYEMCRGIRIATVERGLDPRDFTLVAYGGAGPLHACELAEYLDIRTVVVPEFSGVFTALGLACMDKIHRYDVPIFKKLNEISIEYLMDKVLKESEKIVKKNLGEGKIIVEYVAYMRYLDQDVELSVRLSENDTIDDLRRKFEEKYYEEYGYLLENVDIELTRVVTVVREYSNINIFRFLKSEHKESHRDPIIDKAEVYVRGEWTCCPVIRRDLTYPGYSIAGPAVIADPTCTIFLNDGWKLMVDDYRNIIMVRE